VKQLLYIKYIKYISKARYFNMCRK